MKTNKSYLLITAVLTFLFSLPPTQTLAQETIINRLDKKLDVKLPNDYETKVKEFLDTCFWNVKSKDNNTVRDIKTRMQNFTEQLIVEQMKNDWGIDRQNQLLFIWNEIIEQTFGKDIYDGEDGDNKKLQDFEKAIDNIITCGKKYKNGMIPLVKERSAEARQRNIDKRLEALTEIINYFDEYITSFKDEINLDGVTQTLSDFNQEKNILLNRAEKLRSEQQSNQQLSATEAENLKKSEEQLLSDLTSHRTAVVKQIYAVIEKNIPEIEKRISSSTLKNEKAQQQIDEAKQRFDEAQKAIADSKLSTAEDRLLSTMALLISADAKLISAEAQRRMEELDSIGVKEMIKFFNLRKAANQDEIDWVRKTTKKIIESCKKLNIDYKAILRKEVGDDNKVKEILKYYEIE